MIATRTPFRITLGGGGTDLPSFYRKHGGFVVALGIDKYMYVVVNVPHADRLVRLHYTRSETVADVSQLQHELAREALLRHGIHDAIEIASVADLPAGTGLGSSSCYLVGLLNALRAYTLNPASLETLAEEACEIELDTLRKPIGKQDQYMAVYGGLTTIEIDRAGVTKATRLNISPYSLSDFVANTHLYYTNVQRVTTDVLAEQNQAMNASGGGSVEESLLGIRDIGYRIAEAMGGCNFDRFGELMHEHWLAKRNLSDRVTLPVVEQLYEHVRAEYGVLGGKVAGAGGGGFWMLYCPRNGDRLMKFMAGQGLPRLHYAPELEGSRVIANGLKTSWGHFHAPAGKGAAGGE
ncbi:MAG: galactokinase [Acidobacteriia bacterium]|nr:galactokinase [Terriglobia bacterium]